MNSSHPRVVCVTCRVVSLVQLGETRVFVIGEFSFQSCVTINTWRRCIRMQYLNRQKNGKVLMLARATLHQVLSSIAFPPDSMHYSP